MAQVTMRRAGGQQAGQTGDCCGPSGTSSGSLATKKPQGATGGQLELAESPHKQQHQEGEPIQMRRTLGVWNGIAIIIGVIVGSGIFVSPKGVLEHSGSVGASLLVWGLCGLLALLGALCFAELGTSISSSGGEYTYIRLAYGPLASFLYIWVLFLVIMPCSNAISALTFANYCLQPLYDEQFRPPEEAIRLLALAILMLLIYVNCRTVSGSIKLQSSFTFAKVFALGMIIFYGIWHISTGNPFRSLSSEQQQHQLEASFTATNGSLVDDIATFDNFINSTGQSELLSASSSNNNNNNNNNYSNNNSSIGHPKAALLHGWWAGTQRSLPDFARAFYSGFFTYSGWSSLNAATEEIKDGARNIPRAIVISITSVTLIYLMTNLAYFSVLTKQQILASDAIAVLFGDHVPLLAQFGLRWLMPFVVALSTVGGLNASIFCASRVYFSAAREGQLFASLATINLDHLTPVPSLLLLGVTSCFYLFTTKILALIEYMTFVEASFAALAVSTMLVLRVKLPNLHRPLKVPLLIPCLYLCFTAAMLLLPLMSSPFEALIGLAITLTGLPAYYLTTKWGKKPANYGRTMEKFNRIIQMLTMSVEPTSDAQVVL